MVKGKFEKFEIFLLVVRQFTEIRLGKRYLDQSSLVSTQSLVLFLDR